MYGITSCLKAFGDMLKSLFDYLLKTKEEQSETEVLKDKKTLKSFTIIILQETTSIRNYA